MKLYVMCLDTTPLFPTLKTFLHKKGFQYFIETNRFKKLLNPKKMLVDLIKRRFRWVI